MQAQLALRAGLEVDLGHRRHLRRRKQAAS
jgi:hypothetical protein